MKISNYAYLCSIQLLKKLYTVSGDDNVKLLHEQYSGALDNRGVDVKWMLISTSLLMSEGLFKDDNSYDYISDKTVDFIEEKLFLFERLYVGDITNKPCLLDSSNNYAFAFSDFLFYKELDDCDYDLDNMVEINEENARYLKEENEFLDKYKQLKIEYIQQGCNDSIMTNDVIDIKKLIVRVRNALAHSNYEIINEDNIRLYHYNRKEKKLDFNIILDTKTIINIMDELNENAYEKYSDFKNLYLSHSYIDYKLAIKKSVNDDDFIDYIMSFNLCDRDTAMSIYNKAIDSELYKTIVCDSRFIDDSHDVNIDSVNKMAAIVEVIFDYIKPCCEFGAIINNIMYTNDNGSINNEELYNKIDVYDYLKSDFYGSNFSKNGDVEFNKNYINLLILSFLNCFLLTTHNEYENNNIDYITFDFSDMNIDSGIMKKFLTKHILENEGLIKTRKKQVEDIDEKIEKRNTAIVNKANLLLSEYRDVKYFNEDLPKSIIDYDLVIKELKNDRKELLDNIKEISFDLVKYNYEKDLSDFIFRSLRNSLAHGNVKIYTDTGNVTNFIILFEDYNPDNNELTFRGKIKLSSLFKILINNENVFKLYNVSDIIKNKKKL